jgi:hypothetical protein
METSKLATREFKKIETQAICIDGSKTSVPQHYYEKGFMRACEMFSAEINKGQEAYHDFIRLLRGGE